MQVRDAKKFVYEQQSIWLYETYQVTRPPTLTQHCMAMKIFSIEDLYNANFHFPWRLHPFLYSKKSTIGGDSGGPLMLQTSKTSWTLIGIAIRESAVPSRRILNFCNGIGEEFHYSEYQLVAPLLPWIRKILEETNWQHFK